MTYRLVFLKDLSFAVDRIRTHDLVEEAMTHLDAFTIGPLELTMVLFI